MCLWIHRLILQYYTQNLVTCLHLHTFEADEARQAIHRLQQLQHSAATPRRREEKQFQYILRAPPEKSFVKHYYNCMHRLTQIKLDRYV